MTDQPPSDGVTPPSDPGAFQPFTLPEAARRLGVGQSTVRRMVKAGKLRAETVLRPQGSAWVVYLPDAPSTDSVEAPGHPPLPGGSARSTDPPHAPAPSAPDALAAWVVTLMAPLAEANARQHETIISQADQLVTIARENGVLTERLAGLERVRDAAVAHAAELEERLEAAAAHPPEPAPDPFPAPIPPTPNAVPWDARWQARTALALAVVATLAVAATLAPAWVR